MKSISAILLGVLLITCGCSRLHTKTSPETTAAFFETDSKQTREMMQLLAGRNICLKTFKSIGKIRIRLADENVLQSARGVWAGDNADRLRIEVLGLTGQPWTSFAYDGNWIYLLQHTENRFYKHRSLKADLQRLISLPIQVSDILILLSGRAPIRYSSGARLMRHRLEDEYVLIFEKGWRRKQNERIYLRDDGKTFWKYEQFNQKKRLLYRVELFDVREYDGFQIPQKLIFSDESMVRLEISIKNFWPNVDVPSTLFVLSPPRG